MDIGASFSPHAQLRRAKRLAPTTVVFADDPTVTFVNYGTENNFQYRQEARLHNARRKLQKSKCGPSRTCGTAKQTLNQYITTEIPFFNPKAKQEAFCPAPRSLTVSEDNTFHSSKMERLWRDIFTNHFHLPLLRPEQIQILSPAKAFLNAAWRSECIYRSIVITTVAGFEARRGRQPSSMVFRNQALLIKDFRRLVEKCASPNKLLSVEEFEHLFALAFSFYGSGFGKEEGFNAICAVNSTFLLVPENCSVDKSAIAEWLSTLMPRPYESFHRTQQFRQVMLAKIESILDFLEKTRAIALASRTSHLSRYFEPGTALHTILTTQALIQRGNEPYHGFYSICLHRILFSLHIYLNQAAWTDSNSSDDTALMKLEELASQCLQCPDMQAVTLFVWTLLSDESVRTACHDVRETHFAWAMRDLISVHCISFEKELFSWLPRRDYSQPTDAMSPEYLEHIRKQMQAYYLDDRGSE